MYFMFSPNFSCLKIYKNYFHGVMQHTFTASKSLLFVDEIEINSKYKYIVYLILLNLIRYDIYDTKRLHRVFQKNKK